MPLERLVEEIRLKGEAELAAERQRLDAEIARIIGERDAKVSAIRGELAKTAELEATRERVQKVASARLQARKLAYEARERQMVDALAQSKAVLKSFTQDPEYPQLLKRMYAYAADELGKSVKIFGRAEDAAALKAAGGKSFDDRTVPILGGLIAETSDGLRRLNLSFDELVRLREAKLRDLLAK
jgi:V/A-type H+/Na+-transporting ATPase subunit E